MRTGVCYYPEHWPEERWATDAAHMRRLGLSVVRIGEFAWSRLEERDGSLSLDWLERAMNILHDAGLSIVLGTPTATPPRWMLDKYPDMLAVDAQGRRRDFGSRRHYCFSHEPYIDECRRIVSILAERFGEHPGLIAWQTDNEYGCHSTSISYSAQALAAFRGWCADRYTDIRQLNLAWGNVFWSMEYDSFEQIGLPVGTVTESNPSHQLAYWRFSSAQIRRFNRAQVEILRKLSPGRDILHNYMGNFVEFDHHELSRDLDIATWDNYPLGFLTRDSDDAEDQKLFLRTGHPDSSAFHHDLYRGCCNGRWWVMEQQPGPVNWAPYNPSPASGMVRLWGWEAFAHGAEVMSYFRWRQAPFGQEQTHTGVLLPNGDDDVAAAEIAVLNRELDELASLPANALTGNTVHPDDRIGGHASTVQSSVAIVFSYAGIAMQDIQPPGGSGYSSLDFCQRLYGACRQWGVNVDIVSPQAALDHYRLILVCTSTEDDAPLVEKLEAVRREQQPIIALFPGTGSRSSEYRIPDELPPGQFARLIPVRIVRSESLPLRTVLTASDATGRYLNCARWREHVNSPIEPRMRFSDGWGFHYEQERIHYINAIPDDPALRSLAGEWLQQAGLPCRDIGPLVRTQRIGPYRLAFNFGTQRVDLDKHLGPRLDFHHDTQVLIGSRTLDHAQVAVWVVR
ncbi:MAG: beta-galactosidase [Granulosicoccus sp.]|nr:beta-galactosidase [Granulosicoccus sp.]